MPQRCTVWYEPKSRKQTMEVSSEVCWRTVDIQIEEYTKKLEACLSRTKDGDHGVLLLSCIKRVVTYTPCVCNSLYISHWTHVPTHDTAAVQ